MYTCICAYIYFQLTRKWLRGKDPFGSVRRRGEADVGKDVGEAAETRYDVF